MSNVFEGLSYKVKYKIPTLFIIAGFFLSQFYFWSSGLPQLSHILLILALGSYCIFNRYLSIPKIQALNIFILYVIINNLIWFLVSDFNSEYLLSTLYWVFNYLIFILIINLKDYPLFTKLILISIMISYILEVIIWILGVGRSRFLPRYNGLFNDPNQMAFWVLSTCSIYIFLSKSKLKDLIVYCLAIFLILLTLSRSALLGIPFLTLAIILKSEGGIQKKVLITTISFVIVSIALAFLFSHGYFDSIINRFTSGLNDRDSQGDARGFNALYNFPEHLLFGAGQGRYNMYTGSGEIHSTWLGLLFYYGIFGSSLFFIFLYQIFRRLTISDKLLIISPMLYGFTTYSVRNTIFWFVIAVFMILGKNDAKK